MISSVHLLGKISVLHTLIRSPELFPNKSNKWFKICNSARSGFANKAASSAYSEQRSLAALRRICFKMPLLAANSINLWRGSMAKMKSISDSRSPWQSPLACLNFFLSTPLSSTLDEAVASNVDIQSRPFCPNPSASKTSRRKIQLSKSKTFEISNLRRLASLIYAGP